ncbi:hypothetical protein BC793_118123 [Actinoplanes xinjiangensis]|jgi:hypothetical protein|uniref:Uncharacterized protein n=1 Tax=Actinoplanes xinjiangensis TaxID=512350 RepID=A0A316F8C7_9ACTN|nr:hypothetical protein BC793_118123 [Actinoplanes xinjiangensis]GIF43407.1 hypothetical protein Axi01nite_77180 [Actinoplanes xinjiangensis]
MPTDSSTLQIIGCIVISAFSAYAGGRFHQWYKRGLDRDRSFREGYRHGYQTLFPLVSRSTRPGSGELSAETSRD